MKDHVTPITADNDDDVPSPCRQVCVVHPEARICTGCLRSLDEIAGWMRMSPAEKRALLDQLPERWYWLSQRRGGRAGRIARR